jgi:hypothetical protein
MVALSSAAGLGGRPWNISCRDRSAAFVRGGEIIGGLSFGGPKPHPGAMNASEISYFARTNHRNTGVPFGIKQNDRLSHIYIIGKTGTGKSTLLETLARQDADSERGFALIDPHGDLADQVSDYLSKTAPHRLIKFDAADPWLPYGFNILRQQKGRRIPLAVSGFLETFKKIWPDAWGVRMEHIFRNTLYALLERQGSTLPDILRLYADEDFRKEITANIRNEVVRKFWLEEFDHYPPRLKAEAVAPIQNKIGALLSDPLLHRILVTPQIDLRFRRVMDEGKMLVANLSKGRIGAQSSTLLASLLVSMIGLAGFSRAETDIRRPFFLYLDEFHNMTTLMLADMMAELRKYGVGLILAHQYLHQLEPDIRHAVLGNAGTVIAFRVGPEDAFVLADEFQPKFKTLDLLNLPNRSVYLKLMIDDTPSLPFSADVLAPELLPFSRPVHRTGDMN